MSNYDNNMKAAIWKNEKREKDTHPHFKGNATIDGIDYYVSAWLRDESAKPNAPALKLAFTKVSDIKDAAISQASQTLAPSQSMDIDEDLIPF